MARTNRGWMATLIVGSFLGLPVVVSAGPYVNLAQPCDCPPNHYSALQYTTPVFYRWAAWCQGPSRYTFAKIKHPDIPLTYISSAYHCPAVNPLQFSLDHYLGLGGTPPCSTYQSPPSSRPPRKESETLPPPKLDDGKK